MEGHIDGISSVAKNPNHLKRVFSVSMDGDIRLWDIASGRTVCQFPGLQMDAFLCHVESIALSCSGMSLLVLIWGSVDSAESSAQPLSVCVWKNALWAADHQWEGELFATAGAEVDIWDHKRSQPVNCFQWGTDTSISVRFNPGEPNLLATSANDRSITLYDLRMASPVRKIMMMTFLLQISVYLFMAVPTNLMVADQNQFYGLEPNGTSKLHCCK